MIRLPYSLQLLDKNTIRTSIWQNRYFAPQDSFMAIIVILRRHYSYLKYALAWQCTIHSMTSYPFVSSCSPTAPLCNGRRQERNPITQRISAISLEGLNGIDTYDSPFIHDEENSIELKRTYLIITCAWFLNRDLSVKIFHLQNSFVLFTWTMLWCVTLESMITNNGI